MTRTLEYTRNPFRLAYAEVRRVLGFRVERWVGVGRGERAKRHPRLHKWGVYTESRYNCLIEPWLGRAVYLQSKSESLSARSMRLRARAASRRGVCRFATLLHVDIVSARAWDLGQQYNAHRALRYPEEVGAWEALVGPDRPRT